MLSERTRISAKVIAMLTVAGALSVLLLLSGRHDYPGVHTALDASAALLSGILALLFWDMGVRFNHPVPRWLSISFAVTSVLESVHVLVTVEWFGVLAPVRAAAGSLRPATWPPAAYVLPIGVIAALVLWKQGATRALPFAITLLMLGLALVAATNALPRYTAPTWLGITRPVLIAVPLLWSAAAVGMWKRRLEFRMATVLSVAAAFLVATQSSMLYSTAPDDSFAMIAHLGKVAAYLAILLALMQLAAKDMASLAEAERRLAESNDHLERRVRERTDELTASEHRFRDMIENSADGISLLAPDGTVLYRSPTANRLLGLPDDTPYSTSAMVRIHPDDAEGFRENFARVVREPGVVSTLYVRILHHDGTWRTFESALTNMLSNPNVGALVANFRDITTRLQAETAAREGAERFREMAEHIKEAFFVVEIATQRILYMSPTWSEIWGRPIEEGYDAAIWFEAVHPEDRATIIASQAAVKAGKSDDSTFRVRRPDGTIRWVRARVYPVRNADGEVRRLVGVSEDITELRSAEERFTQAQKMEAIGRLAGGVAHDFNNLLTVIMGETELVQFTLPKENEVQAGLSEVMSASRSAVGLTQQLLAFSRKQLIEPVVFSLNDAVADTSKMLRRVIGEDVRLELKLGADAGHVRADRGQMAQVLTNLAVNARDAMPDGGALMIETAFVTLDADYATLRPDATPGDYAMLVVSDTGTGMTAEVLAHAFEPFYTTKETGKGTGLGLATCHGIIRQAGGHVAVYSELGVGTTFRVYLPSVKAVTEPAAAAEISVRGGTETLLFVEDDPAVRRIGARLLRGLGYTVLEGRDAIEALSILSRHAGAVDLLFTDVVLPGVGGRELAERVTIARPGIKVLFASGYTDDVILQHQLLTHDVALISKPYTRVGVAQKVRAILDTSTE